MAGTPARESIRFLFGREERTLADVDPTLTVLDWLRLRERRTGAKEGCAEGDCGACTVLVGRLEDGRVRYEAINACIRFAATLDGCHLVTVEDLRDADGRLHPVQQAIVDHQGTQCGFCTPGIVMALYGLWLNQAAATDDDIETALQGNLCRCTGYAPIVAAARRVFDGGDRSADPLLAGAAEIAQRLTALDDGATVRTGADGRRFVAPVSLDALAEAVQAAPNATIVAGATDAALWVTKELRRPDEMIYLGRVAALRTLADADGALSIGAGVSYTDAWAALAARYPGFAELVGRIGGAQIRNAGTIGGNIANGSPIGDMPPPLIALGAELVLRGGSGQRRLPLESFFVDYGNQDLGAGEFVEAVRVPHLAPGSLFNVYKVSKRLDEDITAVLGAFWLSLDAAGVVQAARIAFGGMAATPKRAAAAEAALIGQPWNETTQTAAGAALAQDFQPISDWRASAGYRALVARNLLRRFYLETTAGEAELRVDRRWAGRHG